MANRVYALLSVLCLGACASAKIGVASKGGWHHSRHTDWSWKWSLPVPHGNMLNAVWVAPNDDAWAAGSAGTIVHLSVKHEEVLPTPTRQTLHGIWGSRSNDIWAVGRHGTILHWDGHVWKKVPSPIEDDLKAIWGSDSGSVWAIAVTLVDGKPRSRGGTILHWDNKQWSVIARDAATRFTAVWGTSRTDVYVGARGSIRHFDGSAWSTHSFEDFNVAGIWGTGADDVWAIGGHRTMAHWNGEAWSLHSVEEQFLTAISGTGRDNVWATGGNGPWHIKKPRWQESVVTDSHTIVWEQRTMGWEDQGYPDAMQIKAVAGRNGGALWMVGSNGSVMLQESGKPMKTIRPVDFTLVRQPLADDQGAVWVFDESAAHARRKDGNWHVDDSLLDGLAGRGELAQFRFHVDGTKQLWACGMLGCSVRTHKQWGNGVLQGRIDDLSSADGAQVWAVRGHELLTWRGGKQWKAHALAGTQLVKTAGTALNDIWLISDNASVLHFDGKNAVPAALPENLYPMDVCVNARDDAWIAGLNGMAHWDGAQWLVKETPEQGKMLSIWCGGRDDVWASGDNGLIISWDGKSWRETPTPTTTPLYKITGGSTGVWATGWGGVVLHYGP
ncbi:MAG: hypothetical protein SF187_04035 [Deltaproteobacteria bacterium]|nr:hypothetical protein [Deltaproteobacteria bacterium]